MRGGQRLVRIAWHTAYAGVDPIAECEVWRGAINVGKVAHAPQVGRDPFVFEHAVNDRASHRHRVVAVDAGGQKIPSNDLFIPPIV